MNDVLTKTETIICQECSKAWHSEVSILYGKKFFQRICLECREKRKAKEHEEFLENKRVSNLYSWNEKCPPIYRETDISRLPAEQFSKVIEWKFDDSGRGLLIGGPSGKGKTRAIWVLLKKLFSEKPDHLIALTETSLANAIGTAFRNGSGEEYIKMICKAKVLFLDDLGHASATARFQHEILHIVEERTAWKRPILATLNATSDELQTKLGEVGGPVVRRLREFCEIINFK